MAGAAWLLMLRLALPTSHSLAGDRRFELRFDGERAAVAGVYDAVAALLDAAAPTAPPHGGPRSPPHSTRRRTRSPDPGCAATPPPRPNAGCTPGTPRRSRSPRPRPRWPGRGSRCRAAPARRPAASPPPYATAPPAGPLPPPPGSAPGLRALDDALLHAAEAFDRADGRRLHGRRRTRTAALRTLLGARGREYGMRVALCFGASAAVAQVLHQARWNGQHEHWYWLPATAVFLVKPDLGPLASRVLSRAAGTVLGALLFAGLAAVLPRPEGLVLLVTVCGALIPLATRHFAAQTAVVTVLVLALVMAGASPRRPSPGSARPCWPAPSCWSSDTCPRPAGRGDAIRARLAEASGAAREYLAHVLGESADREARWALRREAYRTLAEARTAIALASAELPPLARHADGADETAAALERLVDTTTACAVHLDDTGGLDPTTSAASPPSSTNSPATARACAWTCRRRAGTYAWGRGTARASRLDHPGVAGVARTSAALSSVANAPR